MQSITWFLVLIYVLGMNTAPKLRRLWHLFISRNWPSVRARYRGVTFASFRWGSANWTRMVVDCSWVVSGQNFSGGYKWDFYSFRSADSAKENLGRGDVYVRYRASNPNTFVVIPPPREIPRAAKPARL